MHKNNCETNPCSYKLLRNFHPKIHFYRSKRSYVFPTKICFASINKFSLQHQQLTMYSEINRSKEKNCVKIVEILKWQEKTAYEANWNNCIKLKRKLIAVRSSQILQGPLSLLLVTHPLPQEQDNRASYICQNNIPHGGWWCWWWQQQLMLR